MSYSEELRNVTLYKTTTPLGASATYSSGIVSLIGYHQVQTAVLADADGTMSLYFYSDAGGTDLVRQLSIPYSASKGFELFSAPAFTDYAKYEFTDGGSGQTDFLYETKALNSSLSGQLLNTDATISPKMVSSLCRSVTVGTDPNGVFTNTPSSGVDDNNTTTANLGISGVFTGTWTDVRNYAEIKVSFDADVAGADCVLEFSPDGATVERSISVPPQANALQTNFGGVHTLNTILPYFRVVYTNGSVAQTSFSLTTSLSIQSTGGLISRATQTINKYNDVSLVRVTNDANQDRNFGLTNYQESARTVGTNTSLSTSTETIWEGAALGAGLNYVFLQAADTVRVKAGGNAADDTAGAGARVVTVSGLDANWNEISEDITLAGALASASTTAYFIRINSMETKTVGTYGGTNTGDITLEDTSGTVELIHIPAGKGTSRQAIYSVPANHSMYITNIFLSCTSTDTADFSLYHISFADDFTTPFSSVKHLEWGVQDFAGSENFVMSTYLKFDEKSDVLMEGIRNQGAATADVAATFEYILVDESL